MSGYAGRRELLPGRVGADRQRSEPDVSDVWNHLESGTGRISVESVCGRRGSALKRHRLWTPLQVRRLTREVNASLGKLLAEYEEAHSYVFERRDSATDENQGHRISSSGKSDPTGEAVISQEDNRKRLAQATRKLQHAAQEIDAAQALVKRVFSSPDDYYQPLESYRP